MLLYIQPKLDFREVERLAPLAVNITESRAIEKKHKPIFSALVNKNKSEEKENDLYKE
jgi:hypothetical protein